MGGFRFEAQGTPSFHFSTQKARALLVYLAVEAPQSFRRSHLAGLLWSEYSEEKALHNLRQTLVRLRKGWTEGAEPIPLLVTHRDKIALNPKANIWVDLHAFDKAFHCALTNFHDRQRLEGLDIQALIEAVVLYKGSFLDRFSLFDSLLFDEWALLVREGTAKKALEAQNLLCEYFERRGDFVQASHLADKIFAMAPWDNQTCAHSMQLYALQEQWTNAKNQYLQLEKYLQKNLGVLPKESVTRLYHEIRELSNSGQTLPPVIPVIESSVPRFSSSFVGREAEIGELSQMLANPHNRLISLIGQGGVGKTRLALEIGQLMRGLYAHGVFFIPLRDVSSKDGLDRQMEECLKFSFSGTAPHHLQMLDYLREKQCLMILDGCENHLLRDPIRNVVTEILANALGIKFLSTSRERLDLHEEHVYILKGLNYRLDDSPEMAADCTSTEAVILFEERARQIDHQFNISGTNLPLIEELCFKVEGHPLSIELMASATATLSIPDLLNELNANTGLWDPMQSAQPNQGHNLSIVLERSWQLLSETQQLVLCRLVSFQGGFAQEAALHITQTTAEILLSLVEKSFIHRVGVNRYALHDIIQEFATHKAKRRNLFTTTRQIHAEYFIALLERIARDNPYSLQIDALEQIEADLDNILCAWDLFIEKNSIEKLKNCIDILYQFYNTRSLFEEGILLFQKAIHSAGYLVPFEPILGVLANRLGSLAQRSRRNEMAYQMHSRALIIFEQGGSPSELGLANIGLGNFYLRTKDFHKALNYSQEGLAYFRSVGDRFHEGIALFLLGLIYERSADYSTAKQLLEEALEISREVGDQRGMILRLNQLAGHDCNAGDYKRAEQRYLESLQLSRLYKDRFQQAIILNNLASIYHPRQEYEQEEQVLKESLEICQEIGDLDGEAIALNNLGEMEVARGNYAQALDYSRIALDIALRLGEDWTIIAVYDILGCAYFKLEDYSTAYQCFQQAIQIAFQIQSWDLLTRSLVNLSEAYLTQEEHDKAAELLLAALSHPSMLYEYGIKAGDLLERLGVTTPTKQDGRMLFTVLDRHFNLR